MKKRLFAGVLAVILLLALTACTGENHTTDPSETQKPTETTVPAGETVTLPGSGTEEDPWLIGSPEADGVRLYIQETFLIAEGEGAMLDFHAGDVLPWTESMSQVEYFFWDSGITNVGSYSFCGLGRGEMGVSLYLPAELVSIGAGAFEGSYFDYTTKIPESVETVESRAFAGTTAGTYELEGAPRIAEDAFAGAQAEIAGRTAKGWTTDVPAFCTGNVSWLVQYTFAYEVDYGTEDVGLTGEFYLGEGESYLLDGRAEFEQEGFHFVRYELVEGDLAIEDPTNPELELNLSGDVRMNVICEAD